MNAIRSENSHAELVIVLATCGGPDLSEADVCLATDGGGCQIRSLDAGAAAGGANRFLKPVGGYPEGRFRR